MFKNLIFVPVKVQSLFEGGLFGWTNSHNLKDFISENFTLDNICIALSLLATSLHDSAVSFWGSQWYFCIKMCLASNHSLHRDYDRFKP